MSIEARYSSQGILISPMWEIHPLHLVDPQDKIVTLQNREADIAHWMGKDYCVVKTGKDGIVEIRFPVVESPVLKLSEQAFWREDYLNSTEFNSEGIGNRYFTCIAGADDYGYPRGFNLFRYPTNFLIGAITRYGKTELMKTILSTLCYSTPPELLKIIVMDFKGAMEGSYEMFSVLPHFNLMLGDRIIDSPIYNLSDCGEVLETLIEYVKIKEGIGKVLIVFDEITELSNELFKLLAVYAQRGLSRGFNLGIATQRPGNMELPPEVRANLDIRFGGRADDAGSKIIMGVASSVTGENKINIRGLFVTNLSREFPFIKGYLTDRQALLDTIRKYGYVRQDNRVRRKPDNEPANPNLIHFDYLTLEQLKKIRKHDTVNKHLVRQIIGCGMAKADLYYNELLRKDLIRDNQRNQAKKVNKQKIDTVIQLWEAQNECILHSAPS